MSVFELFEIGDCELFRLLLNRHEIVKVESGTALLVGSADDFCGLLVQTHLFEVLYFHLHAFDVVLLSLGTLHLSSVQQLLPDFVFCFAGVRNDSKRIVDVVHRRVLSQRPVVLKAENALLEGFLLQRVLAKQIFEDLAES